jgi:hypothetical protein
LSQAWALLRNPFGIHRLRACLCAVRAHDARAMHVRRRLLLILLGVGVLVGVIALVVWPAPEPEYHGKRLSEWIDQANWGKIRSSNIIVFYGMSLALQMPGEAVDAVRGAGTNAVPFLLAWIRYEPPAWKRKSLTEINRLFHLALVDHKAPRADGAVWALSILGVKAEAGVPRLAMLMNDDRAPRSAGRATVVLSDLAWKLPSANIVLMTNNSASLRRQSIGKLASARVDTLHSALPGLIHCLEDKDAEVAEAAAIVLGQSELEPNLVVPALTASLQRPVVRRAAITALGKFRDQARPAVPALVILLTDPVPLIKKLATNALLRIDSAALGLNHGEKELTADDTDDADKQR